MMTTYQEPSLDWLTDVNVFAVNRVPAHSDHLYYATMEEAERGRMKMRHELNGKWKFSYAFNPGLVQNNFTRWITNAPAGGDINVPGHIQLQGYGQPQYVNTMYPWDGHNEIRPPEIPTEHNPVGSYVKILKFLKTWKTSRFIFLFKV